MGCLYGMHTNGMTQSPKPSIEVPDAVTQTLDVLFPDNTEVQWSKQKRKFRADFIYQGLNISVTLDKKGEVYRLVEEIRQSRLPAPVQEKLKSNYASFKVLMTLRRVLRTNKTEFDVEIIKGEKHLILNFDPNGYLFHQYEVHKTDWADFVN